MTAESENKKLYVLFSDYSKACDGVPLDGLTQILRSRGCGKVMLRAIQVMYMCTSNALQLATITATTGVWQGAPSSWLFLLCVWTLLLMDEVILTTAEVEHHA